MNDRKGWSCPRDEDGEPLIDSVVLRRQLDMTAAGARRWAQRNGIHPARRGRHGTWLYRISDVADAMPDRVSSGSH